MPDEHGRQQLAELGICTSCWTREPKPYVATPDDGREHAICEVCGAWLVRDHGTVVWEDDGDGRGRVATSGH